MALTIFIILTWLVIMTFIILPKSFSFTENSFLFLLMSIIVKNTFTIVGLNLEWIKGSEKPELFLSYLLYRTIIYPLLLVIMINIFFHTRKYSLRLIIVLSAAIVNFLIEILGEKLHVYSYNQWTHWYFLVEITLFILITYCSAKLIHYIELRKNRYESI
ncbi:hypothetical protein [Bacillus sp. AK128]